MYELIMPLLAEIRMSSRVYERIEMEVTISKPLLPDTVVNSDRLPSSIFSENVQIRLRMPGSSFFLFSPAYAL